MVTKKKKELTPEEKTAQVREIGGSKASGVLTIEGKDFVVPKAFAEQIGQAQPQETGEQREPAALAATQEKIAGAPVDVAVPIPKLQTPKVPFDPATAVLSKIPFTSEAMKGTEQALEAGRRTDILRRIEAGQATEEEIMQAKFNFSLTDFDIETIKSGEASISKTAQFIEGIIIVPPKLKQFVNIFSSPSKQVDDLKNDIIANKDNINIWANNAKANPSGAAKYISMIKAAEQENLRLQSRIKILAIHSPELQGHPEQINDLSKEITGLLGIIQGRREELMLLGLR